MALSATQRVSLLVLCLIVLWAGVLLSLRKRARAIPNENETDPSVQLNKKYSTPRLIAHLQDKAIDESSGLIASRVNPGLYWTHNDSGDGPFIYAFDTSGAKRGVWQVTGAKNRDWESISAGPGPDTSKNYIYIGDTGDNGGRRFEVQIYRFVEPSITAADAESTRKKPRTTEPAETIHLRYPDGEHDAEALMVHPRSGDLYLVTKVPLGNPHVYKARAPLSTTETSTMEDLGEVPIPSILGGVITDGDISPDGNRVALCDYMRGYEFTIAGENFDAIWKQPPAVVSLGPREQGEAIAYRLDGNALLATSEGKNPPLNEIDRK